MNNLRTLTLRRCRNLHLFMDALHSVISSLEVMVCPELEEIIFIIREGGGGFVIESVIEMAAARAEGGMQLTRVRIIDQLGILEPVDVSELMEQVISVTYGPGVIVVNDGSDEED